MPPTMYTARRPVKNLPSRKKRKIVYENNGGEDSTLEHDGNGDGSFLGTKAKESHTEHAGLSVCVSCHRGLATSMVECALCHSFSCVICARQCATFSRTSAPEARTGNSPLTPSDTNATSLRRHRRRKLESGGAEQEECVVSAPHDVGCNRTICGRCCVENSITHAYTCIRCMNVVEEKSKEKVGERDSTNPYNGA